MKCNGCRCYRRTGEMSIFADSTESPTTFVEAPGATVPFDNLPIGSNLRVMPNHACMTAAAYEGYHVVDGGDEVVAVWERTNRW